MIDPFFQKCGLTFGRFCVEFGLMRIGVIGVYIDGNYGAVEMSFHFGRPVGIVESCLSLGSMIVG